jgi:uncharacterized DUF497 family protein
MGLEFEWDASKAKLNYIKNGVRFDDAIAAFRDPLAKLFDDPGHSETEQRTILVGHSADRLLVVSFTERRGRIRLISVRRATPREREDYEQAIS